jgi:RNA polymerase sigma-70 factor, ECF subfamily
MGAHGRLGRLAKRDDLEREFERVALVHAASLLRVARRMTQDLHSAEDAVQETLLAAWKGFERFQAGTNCRAWLFKILLNYLNKNRSRPSLPIVDLPETVTLDNVLPIRSDYTDRARADLMEAVASLPEEQRIILLLTVVEGFTCKDIAAMMELPIGTVMSRLSRSRARLRRVLYRVSASHDKASQRGGE